MEPEYSKQSLLQVRHDSCLCGLRSTHRWQPQSAQAGCQGGARRGVGAQVPRTLGRRRRQDRKVKLARAAGIPLGCHLHHIRLNDRFASHAARSTAPGLLDVCLCMKASPAHAPAHHAPNAVCTHLQMRQPPRRRRPKQADARQQQGWAHRQYIRQTAMGEEKWVPEIRAVPAPGCLWAACARPVHHDPRACGHGGGTH